MPILEETRKTAEKAEEQKKLIRDQELQSYSKIAEKVQKALELLNQIKSLRVQAEADRKNCALASENTQKVRKQQETLEQKEIQWKKQSEELAEVDKKLVLAENKKQEADAVLQEIKDVRVLGNQAEQCRKNAIKTRGNYAKITEKYNAVNTEYEEVRLYFLNAQAGFLAAELEPGKPCPVCGSIEHPHPAKKDVESVDISEEKLQNMQTNVDKLRKTQEKAAGDAAAARSEYDTRKDTYIASVRKLQERLHRSISSITEQSSVTEMSNALENWKQQTETELEKLTADAKLLVKIREALQNVEKQKKQLQDTYDECTEKEKLLLKNWQEVKPRWKM